MDRNALTYLSKLNRTVDNALFILDQLLQYPEIDKPQLEAVRAHFRERVADANLVVLGEFMDWEQREMGKAYAIRAAFEATIRDPDDCYFDVARREEERRRQGLPPLIGVLRGMHREASANQTQKSSAIDDEIDTDN